MPEDSRPDIVEQYRQLVMAMNDLSTMTTSKQISEYAVNAGKKLVDAEMALIFVPDHANQTLTLEAVSIPSGVQASALSVPTNDSLEGRVFMNQFPVIVNGQSLPEVEKGVIINLTGILTKSALVLPGILQGKSIFILEVLNKGNGNFTQDDQEILTYLCQHTAICLEKIHLSSQSDLIPELVHELRTPLAALNTALQLLLRTDLPVEKRDNITRMIQSEFNRLADLTTSFLDYSRLRSGREKYRFSQFDLRELIQDCLEIMQTQFDGKKMKISLELPGEPLYLWADRDKIKQVILNILNNAVKYNQEGGNVKIKAEATPQIITFSFSDDGQGIPVEGLHHLFERFYRLPSTEGQIKGTGLGLAICKQIVEAHHGWIGVSSTSGQGSTFTIKLPVRFEKAALQS